jgi:hypothetical protein
MQRSGASAQKPRTPFVPGGGITDGKLEFKLCHKAIARRGIMGENRGAGDGGSGRSSCDCVPDLMKAVLIEANSLDL